MIEEDIGVVSRGIRQKVKEESQGRNNKGRCVLKGGDVLKRRSQSQRRNDDLCCILDGIGEATNVYSHQSTDVYSQRTAGCPKS